MSQAHLLKTIILTQGAVIELTNHDGCKKCGASDHNRKYFKCPHCNYHFCGLCAITAPYQAQMVECPSCHQWLSWT
ncbi:MAG: hypothetical protein V1668_00280 [Patescibacteria group bacterium]